MKHNWLTRSWMVIFIVSVVVFAAKIFAADVTPLRAEQAFIFSSTITSPNKVILQFKIAPGYYLYQDRLHVNFPANAGAHFKLPASQQKFDDTHGKYFVYSGDLIIPVTIKNNRDIINASVAYQGCSEGGFCYPPMTETLQLNMLGVTPVEFSITRLLTNQNEVLSLFDSNNLVLLVALFLGLGILLAFTPCVLPMIPILTGIILGQKHAVGTREAFFLSATYVLGMAITYAIAGMMVASLGSSLQAWLQTPLVIVLVSILFLLLGLSLFGFYDLQISHHWQSRIARWSDQHEGGTYVGVFFMGVLSTLVVSPCVTAPLVGVLIYIAQTGNVWLGGTALFAMGIGMGIPLMLIGLSAGKWLPKSGPWMTTIKATFGLLMMAMAVWLLSRIISDATTKILWLSFVLGIAIFFSIYVPQHLKQYRFNRLFGVVIAGVGLLILLGGIGISSFLQDWRNGAPVASGTTNKFVVVRDLTELNAQLALASQAHQPVLIDYYADWCESCVSMDKKVFHAKNVAAALKNFVTLRVDLSKNTAEDQAMLKRFDVIAPPTVLFFNGQGQEMDANRIVGEVSANQFIDRLNLFTTKNCNQNYKC